MKKTLLFIPATALLLAACNGNDTEVRNSDISFDYRNDAQVYVLQNSASVYECDSDLRIACRANIMVPRKFLGKEIGALVDSIEVAAFDSVGGLAAYENAFHTAAANFGFPAVPEILTAPERDSLAAIPLGETDYDGFYTVSGTVATMTPQLISYRVEISQYAPRAAHGDYEVKYINYDIESGRVLTLDNLFTAEGRQALPPLIARRANLMSGYLGETAITSLPADGTFWITPAGNIEFLYQPYEVASYAQGIIRVPFEPYSLSEYMTDLGKTVFNLN